MRLLHSLEPVNCTNHNLGVGCAVSARLSYAYDAMAVGCLWLHNVSANVMFWFWRFALEECILISDFAKDKFYLLSDKYSIKRL